MHHEKVRYIYLILFLLFSLTQILFANTPDTIWTKSYGSVELDYLNSISLTEDNCIIGVGFSRHCDENYCAWMFKSSSDGDLIWSKYYDFGYMTFFEDVICLPDTTFLVLGTYSPSYYSYFDIILIKMNAFGDTLWMRNIGGAEGRSIKLTQENELINLGLGFRENFGSDVYLVKTSLIGDTIWTKTYGGSKDEYPEKLETTSDDGYIIISTSRSFGNEKIYLIKTDSYGDTLWTKLYNPLYDNEGKSVKETLDGGLLIVGFGRKEEVSQYSSAIIIRTNSSGDTIWTRIIEDDYYNNLEDILVLSDTTYILAGGTGSYGAQVGDFWMLKINDHGDLIWNKIVGGHNYDMAMAIIEHYDGTYIIGGNTYSYGAGDQDAWLVNLDTVGFSHITEPFVEQDIFFITQNYPNPFNAVTTIRYAVGTPGKVELSIYNLLGQKVATLVNDSKPAGNYTVNWDASGFSSGIYYCVLRTGENLVQTRKMVLLK